MSRSTPPPKPFVISIPALRASKPDSKHSFREDICWSHLSPSLWAAAPLEKEPSKAGTQVMGWGLWVHFSPPRKRSRDRDTGLRPIQKVPRPGNLGPVREEPQHCSETRRDSAYLLYTIFPKGKETAPHCPGCRAQD